MIFAEKKEEQMLLIDNTKSLQDFCKTIENEQFITVDLEFLREKTYYAQICLIQIGSKNGAAIVDPLAKELDMSPFWEIMQNEKIVKVFHSGRQDIEILFNLSGNIPSPIFDTQIAAMVCGFGEYISYENLVHILLGRELDKTCRLTNWMARPLDEKQLEYALCDVTHLVDVYEKLREILQKNGRLHWADEEVRVLQTPSSYVVKPEDAWLKIKHSSHNPHFLRVLQRLAEWREKRAQSHNIPRQMIIKDDCLSSIAAMMPKTETQLAQVRNMRKDILNGKLAEEILQVVASAQQENGLKLSKDEKGVSLHSSAAQLYELLKTMLKIIGQKEGVVSRLIASDDDLKKMAMFEQDAKNPAFKGWRNEIFGQKAKLLREGKIFVCYNCAKHCIDFLESETKENA